jgi:hypothetical protein
MAKRDMGTRTMTNSEMQDPQRHVLMREGRVLSRRRPSRPSSAKRSCQRQTQRLDQQRNNHTVARASDSILMGLIFDDRGNRMTPTYAVKKERRSLPLLCVIRPARWPGGCRERPRCADHDDEALAGARGLR